MSEIPCGGKIRVVVSDEKGMRVDYSDLGEAIPPAIRTLVWLGTRECVRWMAAVPVTGCNPITSFPAPKAAPTTPPI